MTETTVRPAPTTDQAAIDRAWLQQAVSLAVENVASGGGPFGAVIVRDGELLAEGRNRVTRDLDPTAHAEVTAIRAACAAVGDFSLAGATLYTSCEPCPLCLAASLWARIDRVVFAADRHDAAAGGFDDLAFYELFARDRADWETAVESLRVDGSVAPFEAWRAKLDRVDY
ncbi:nucleoside deaminase [Agromyces sp. MMS24-JH15]|uniref:nucleoside deaminase n=1 Tax=Agromyces sp. MMS24-JH15 TaxID=3243765 RepID=UPI003748F2C4